MSELSQFSSEELRLADLLTDGFANKQIALVLGTTEATIKHRLCRIYDKSGTWSRLELALWWLNHH